MQAQSLAALPHTKTHLLRFMSMAGNVPSVPRPICIMSLVVTTATTLLRAGRGEEGFLILVTVKTMGLPAANVPAVNVTFSTPDDMKKVAAALLGEVNASWDAAVSAIPVPVSEMMILPLEGTTKDSGVMTTVIVTLASDMLVLLRVMLG
jgi:hypothetical protein